LHQVADLENLIGFKGNYMIFPLKNYLHTDDLTGVTVQDPDPLANLTVDQLKTAIETIYAQDPRSFAAVQSIFQEVMLRLLSTQDPEMVIVPSNSLYIEALPRTHPLLEDFKLIHSSGSVDKVIVVGSGQNVTVDAGQ
jgi:hypothetical protein